MKKMIDFGVNLMNEIKKDNISSISNDLAYKLLLALFPFIIFAFAVLGFLNIDGTIILDLVSHTMPDDAMDVIYVFIDEVIDVRSPTILSTSLLITLVSTSSGFMSVIRGINKSYGLEDTRNFIVRRLISIVLVFLFVFVLTASIVIFVFGDIIENYLLSSNLSDSAIKIIFGLGAYIIVIAILAFTCIIIYKLSINKKVTIMSVIPGSLVTVILWTSFSKLFNIYINNFIRYSKVYGSLASIFILMLYLKLISYSLLVGSEINALIEDKKL